MTQAKTVETTTKESRKYIDRHVRFNGKRHDEFLARWKELNYGDDNLTAALEELMQWFIEANPKENGSK